MGSGNIANADEALQQRRRGLAQESLLGDFIDFIRFTFFSFLSPGGLDFWDHLLYTAFNGSGNERC